VEEPIEQNRVPYIVARKRAFRFVIEPCANGPKPVTTADLFIYKTVSWFPLGDSAAPLNGKPADAQPVINDLPACIWRVIIACEYALISAPTENRAEQNKFGSADRSRSDQ